MKLSKRSSWNDMGTNDWSSIGHDEPELSPEEKQKRHEEFIKNWEISVGAENKARDEAQNKIDSLNKNDASGWLTYELYPHLIEYKTLKKPIKEIDLSSPDVYSSGVWVFPDKSVYCFYDDWSSSESKKQEAFSSIEEAILWFQQFKKQASLYIFKNSSLSSNTELASFYNNLEDLKLLAFRLYSGGKISPKLKKLLPELKMIIDKLMIAK